MKSILVRNVPESVMTALRERATRHGRSMQQELRAILESAATDRGPGAPREPINLIMARTPGTSTWRREEIYDESGR
ncbi:MAG: Arc family DNA-binding protein [Candidatus Dormibacteraeota bacterium]|nr:Arc family DNA-binding protein [Candidatus Dormibacteraeota bacterium]